MGWSRFRRTHGAGDGASARPVALLAAVLLLAGCTQEPLRIEPPVFTATLPQPTPTISRSPRPLENIHNLDLRSQILADTTVPDALRTAVRTCVQCGLGEPVYTDVTKDRIDDVVASIDDVSGLRGWVAYTIAGGQPRLLLAYVTSHASVTASDGDLSIDEQLLAPTDESCCATGPFRQRRYTWNGQTMILTKDTGIPAGFTSPDPTSKVIT